MRLLIVAATGGEVAPVIDTLQGHSYRDHHVDFLVTGVGLVATAAKVSRALTKTRYDLALNVGVCGSFDRALPPGTAVRVISECLAELGAEDGDQFLSAQELGLLNADEFPFTGSCLVGIAPPPNATLDQLPCVRGISVSTAHGHEPSIAAVVRRCNPQVESMEGAAFVYASLIHGVPSAQVRVVSNIVERRNRAAWTLREAIDVLAATTLAILDQA